MTIPKKPITRDCDPNLYGNAPTAIINIGKAGQRGLSAYEVAVHNGFRGTVVEWLRSLVGPEGSTGLTGPTGASAYDAAVAEGFSGTVEDWLETLIGPQGEIGPVGPMGPQGPQGVQGLQGEQGPQGEQGIQGIQGIQGPEGLGAYDVAVLGGFTGTQSEWLESLVGPQGISAYDAAVNNGFTGDESAWLVSLIGPQGEDGPQGEKGEKGDIGDTGPKGDKGDQGEQGIQGPQGETGETGILAQEEAPANTEVLWLDTDDESSEGGGGGAQLSDDTPESLGTASAGVGTEASRDDHVHPMPSAADVGAEVAGAVLSHEAAVNPHPQYTTAAEASAAAPVQSVAGRTGAITLTHTDISDSTATGRAVLTAADAAAARTAIGVEESGSASEYGVFVQHDTAIPLGGYYAARSAVRAVAITRLYVVVDAAITLKVTIGGSDVYSSALASGTHSLSLTTTVAVHDEVVFTLTSGTPTEMWAQIDGGAP